MHDRGCDEIYVIVTDLKRHEMDQVTEYFQYVCRHTAMGSCKPSAERKINHDCAYIPARFSYSPLAITIDFWSLHRTTRNTDAVCRYTAQ